MSVGSELKAARERAGLTIEQLAAETRIRPGLLAALEADDFSRCGGSVYARGHLRAIARAVGTDATSLLAQYDEGRPSAADVHSRHVERGSLPRATLHPARTRWPALLAAVLVGLLGWGMIRLFTLPGDGQARTAQSGPTVAAVTPSARPAPAKPSTLRPPSVPAKPTKVQLTLTGRGDGSYVTLRDARGKRLFQGLLGANSAQSITHQGSIRVTLGAVRNITVLANGKRLEPKSRRFTVTVAGTLAKPR